jgi:hypothetical protein
MQWLIWRHGNAQSDCWQGTIIGDGSGGERGKGREAIGQGEGKGEDFGGDV